MDDKCKDFFGYVERWCMRYKPMLHSEENKRFFLTESFSGFMDFMREIDAVAESPMVIMETQISGELSRFDSTDYVVYFFCKAETQGDGRAAKHAALESKSHMKNFVTYLREDIKKKPNHPFRKMNVESIRYQPIGPLYDHWYGCYIEFEDVQQLNHCVDESLYIPLKDCTCQ